MYQNICTIDYDNLRRIFDDYSEEEIESLYNRYNGIDLLKKKFGEITEYEIEEFLILQQQLCTIYKKYDFFNRENIVNEIKEITNNNDLGKEIK